MASTIGFLNSVSDLSVDEEHSSQNYNDEDDRVDVIGQIDHQFFDG